MESQVNRIGDWKIGIYRAEFSVRNSARSDPLFQVELEKGSVPRPGGWGRGGHWGGGCSEGVLKLQLKVN